MCGIVGILEKNNKEITVDELSKFRDSLSHRGPDNSGIFINKKKNLGLGHRRLSIIDLTNNANQPLVFDNRYYLVFNGEIYNYQIIKKELIELGHKFITSSDSEVLLKSYIQWGENCQFKFNGMWAFAIWDDLKKKLFLSRDRFGVKPLYFQNNNHSFIFSSEIKSFMKLNNDRIPKFDDKIFINQAQNYTNSSYSFGEETFLENVKELPPGHQIEINSNFMITKKIWWKTVDNLYEVKGSDDYIKEQFENLLFDACNLRMISDVEIATSLSGGIDSSSIVATIAELRNKNKLYNNTQVPHANYILNYVGEKDNETNFAVDVSNFTKIKPKVIQLKPSEFSESEIKKIIFHQEEVTGDDGLGPWQIYKNMNNDNIKISIDGQGGDELLAGYSGYPKIAMKDTNPFLNFLYWIDLLKMHLIMNDKINDEKQIFKIINTKIKNFFKNKVNTNDYKNSYTKFFNYQAAERSIIKYDNLENLNQLNKNLYIDFHYKAMTLNLKKYDKFSMAHGVETRFPFMDYRLACFCFSLPNKFKLRNGFTKKILRDSMKSRLPFNVLSRVKKKIFNPEDNFFNKEYRKFIHDTASSKSFQNENIWKGKEILKYISNKDANLKDIFKFIQIFYIKQTFRDFQKNQ